MKRLLLLLLLPLAACSTPDNNDINQNLLPLPPKAISYQCDSGNRIIVTYPTTESAEILYTQEEIPMQIAVSASGARYTGEDLIWWTKGQDGTLFKVDTNQETGDLLERCTQVLK